MTSKKVQLITEFCQNHNGDKEILKRMIDAAAENGATHGKIQTIYADNISFRPQFEEGLSVDGTVYSIQRPYQAEYDRLKNLELTMKDSEEFIGLCNDAGLIPMTTCFAREHVNILSEIGFKVIKVASYDCASYQMIRELADKFEELYISTGATFDNEIEFTSKLLSNKKFAFLHCITIYPTPLHEMHLNRMAYLRNFTPVVGFSDHSLVERDGVLASKAAIASGADIIERHFTVLEKDKTKDGPVSIRAEHLKELSEFCQYSNDEMISILNNECPDWKIMIGEKNRELSDAELLNRDYYRGRFASNRKESEKGRNMIFNWEETPLQ